jgi:hypothetical protein
MKRQAATFPETATKPKKFVFVSGTAVDIASPLWSGFSGQSAHRVFTAFDLFVIVAICAGFVLGLAGGAKLFGAAGGLVGALVGGYAGFTLGCLPEWLVLRSLSLGLARETSAGLRSWLHSQNCPIPNLVFLELQRRGEDVQQEFGVVLDLLGSEELAQRTRGWAALTSAFPELAEQVQDYRLGDSVEECRRKTAELRNMHPGAEA